MPSPGDARDTRAHPRDPTIRLMRIAPMFVRRSLIALAVAFTFVACEDTTGPVNDHGAVPGPQLSRMPSPAMHIVRQSPSAPPLEAYRVSFSKIWPAALTLWYGNADPDLDGDGEVDATDQTLAQHLAVWSQTRKTQPWLKLASNNNANRKFVAARLYHFSEYAVCW